jgi:GNAT superfamily N-acetyltransferase
MSVIIENAVPADVPDILMLIKELAVYERAENEVTVSAANLLRDGFGPDKIFDCFVARENDQVLGIALVYTKYSTWKGRCIYLEDIIVKEDKRGNGIGRKLFKEVVRFAKDNFAGRLEWQVLEWNEPAIGFYKKFNAEFDSTWINCRFTKEQLEGIDPENYDRF